MPSEMKFAPSDGFVELVRRARDPKVGYFGLARNIPTEPDELWNNFLFPMFVGGKRRGAQVNYAVKVLNEFVSLDQARRAQTDPNWTARIQGQIRETIRGLGNSPPEGLKRSILEDIDAEASGLKLASMAAGMSDYIDQLDPTRMGVVRGDFNNEFEFVDSAVGNGAIPYVGYTRFVLWLQNCNSGWTLTPPSGPARWAIGSPDLGFKGMRVSSWEEDDSASDLGLGAREPFGRLCTLYNHLAQVLRPRLGESLTAMEVQGSAWILGTTNSLFLGDARARSKFSARSLLRYLDSRSWDVDSYVEQIADIDSCLTVIQDLKQTL